MIDLASLDSEEDVDRLDENGCDVVSHDIEDPNCGGRTIWIAQRNR